MKCNRDQRGFTLIELMVSLIVTILLVAGAYSTFIIQNRSAEVQQQVSTVQQNGRIAMDALVEEIRRGAYNFPPAPAGAKVIVDSASQITIQKDVNNDGVIDDDPTKTTDDEEWIILQVNANNQLQKVIVHQADLSDAGIQPLADNVQSLTFVPKGGVTTNPTSVLVTLQVRTSDEDPSYTDTASGGVDLDASRSGLARTRTYQEEVLIRNLNS